MTSYDVHYFDREGNHHILSTYANDVMHARLTTEELVGKDLARISGIVAVDNFDW